MADRRALAIDETGLGKLEIPDTDVLKVGSISPATGNLTIGGATVADVVNVATGNDLNVSGGGDLSLSGGGALLVSATGTHQITGGSLDVNVTSDFAGNMLLSAGADLTGTAGSVLSGFDSIEGILSGNLLDKTAAETITGQYTFQAAAGTNPKLIVQAAGGEPADTLLFQVQDSVGSNLFSVDTEGDVVIAGGETIAGAVVYTGDITLGDGGNTIQIGSAAGPTVGDNVYINTTGTANGQFSITSGNFNVSTAGNIDTAGNLTFTNGGTVATTNNGNLTLSPNGTGLVNITSDVLATGFDFGTGGSRLGTVYADTIDATTITGDLTSDGTNSNVWVVNEDGVGTTAESTGSVWLSADGVDQLAWRVRNDNSGELFHVEYKANPTDPKDLSEVYTTWLTLDNAGAAALMYGDLTFPNGGLITSTNNGNVEINPNGTGEVNVNKNLNASVGLDVTGAALTVDASGIDCAGSIDLNGTLSFDAAGTIDTSGNNQLNLSSGTANIVATAGTVDLQTNVTTLDVPAGTGFSIGGTALTTALWTATGVDVVYGGPASNADAYHTHAGGTATNSFTVTSLTTAAMTQYQAAYISANNTVSPTDASSATGTSVTATVAGVYAGTVGEIVIGGKVEVQFDNGLTVNAGEAALLSYNNSGQFTNVPPTNGSKDFQTKAGIILDTTNYATVQRCVILLQPGEPVER